MGTDVVSYTQTLQLRIDRANIVDGISNAINLDINHAGQQAARAAQWVT